MNIIAEDQHLYEQPINPGLLDLILRTLVIQPYGPNQTPTPGPTSMWLDVPIDWQRQWSTEVNPSKQPRVQMAYFTLDAQSASLMNTIHKDVPTLVARNNFLRITNQGRVARKGIKFLTTFPMGHLSNDQISSLKSAYQAAFKAAF